MGKPLLKASDWSLMEAEYEEDTGRLDQRDYWLDVAVEQDKRERSDDKTP